MSISDPPDLLVKISSILICDSDLADGVGEELLFKLLLTSCLHLINHVNGARLWIVFNIGRSIWHSTRR